MKTPSQIDIVGLKSHIEGKVIAPDDPDYDNERKVWNGMIDRRPSLIIKCASREDVVNAISYAKRQSLEVAIRGGGHSIAGNSTCEGGLLLDMSGMKHIHVDTNERKARVQGGVTWGEFDKATQAHNLATTGGVISTTGIAGLTLGGGIGWLMRKYGLACDNLLSVELVTADGKIVRANASENKDLFWGVRGGGGNFGVVTEFEFALHPLGPEISVGMLLYPMEIARSVTELYNSVTKNSPREFSSILLYLMAPPAPFLPPSVHGKQVAGIVFCDINPEDKQVQFLEPLRRFGPPLVDIVMPVPYTAFQSMFDEAYPKGIPAYWKSHYMDSLDDEAITIMVKRWFERPSPISEINIHEVGGAVSDVGEDDAAYSNRKARFIVNILGRWSDPRDTEKNIAWVRGLWDELRPFSSGLYGNFSGDSDKESTRAAFNATKLQRLAELKKKFDPNNFFHLNNNILPK